MAHANIDERRAFVAQVFNKVEKIDRKTMLDIASKFDCHVSAIYADVRYFEKLRTQQNFSKDPLNDWSPGNNLQPESQRIVTPEELQKGYVDLVVDYRILEYFYNHPEKIYYTLNPRQFEEFVAELLSNFGYNVRLSPIGADEGIDIYAERKHIIGTELVEGCA